MQKDYITIQAPAQGEFVEKRSRFIGYIAPVCSEEEAMAFIEQKRKEHFEATHNCYAYVLKDGMTRRYSDDGEPQGTAGVPILEVILREGLVDVAVVVTRYFGGILLGAGGLVRAYSHGAKLAIDAAQRIEMCVCSVLQMQMDYSAYGKILNLLPNYNTVILSTDFGAVVTMEVMVKACFAAPLCADIVELTAALVTPQEKEKCFAQIPE